MKAVKILLTLGDTAGVLNYLHQWRHFDIAALFAAACAGNK
jgi:hypothetical protein